jgi:hypothetical protein
MEVKEDRRRKPLLKKYHTLCGAMGLKDYEKIALLSGYGVQSSADLEVWQLIRLCNTLEAKAGKGKNMEMDALRKRLIAAIGAWLRATNRVENINLIKGIACRAAGVDSFNKIPADRLRSLYNSFRKSKRDLLTVEEMTAEYLTGEVDLN